MPVWGIATVRYLARGIATVKYLASHDKLLSFTLIVVEYCIFLVHKADYRILVSRWARLVR